MGIQDFAGRTNRDTPATAREALCWLSRCDRLNWETIPTSIALCLASHMPPGEPSAPRTLAALHELERCAALEE